LKATQASAFNAVFSGKILKGGNEGIVDISVSRGMLRPKKVLLLRLFFLKNLSLSFLAVSSTLGILIFQYCLKITFS
jgi:hypothetical protein